MPLTIQKLSSKFWSNDLIYRFSSNGPICSHANPFGPHLDLEYTDSGKGLFWMGLNGLGGTLSKLIISIRPQEYETLSNITISWIYFQFHNPTYNI